MSVSQDFIAFLNTQTTITALVGDRICQAPAHVNEQLPYIVFMRQGRTQELDLSGTKDNDHTFLDVECRGKTQEEAEIVADALLTLLHGYRGTWVNRRVQGAFCTDQSNDYVQLPPGSNDHEEVISTNVEIISE